MEKLADVSHGGLALVRVSGAVGQEESVELQLVEVVVPRNAYHFHAAPQQTADNVRFHAAVYQDDRL